MGGHLYSKTPTYCTLSVSAVLSMVCFAATAAAQRDGDVQWQSLSHVRDADRRPLVPLDGASFDVVVQTARDDLTGVRVAVDEGADGDDIEYVNAARASSVGPYDVWRATVPATDSEELSYVFEVSDGEDTDYLAATGVSDALPSDGWWTLDFVSMSHTPRGSTPTDDGTVFRVWAPNASEAYVRGTFNNWSLDHPMTRLGEDFIALVPDAEVGDQYKYFFGGDAWRSDPRSRELDNEDNFNSVITDPLGYEWRNPGFSPAPPEQWAVYQLHVGTFAGRNDPLGPTPPQARYRDVEARVDHLVELGVNAVMLNPINEFPGEQSGGYNSLSMFAFEGTYGTADELKSMIDTLHGRGIAVFLDVVWNHVPSGTNLLWNYDGSQIYFDSPPVGTPWGPQLDLDRAEVRDYYFDSVETVLGEFRLDGYRQDAIFELVSASQYEPGQQLIRATMDRVGTRFSDAHVVGEIYNNSAWNTSPAGIDLDAQYHEAYKNAIFDAVEAAAFGDPDMGRLAAAIDGSGPFVEGDQVFNYYELHDEAWSLSGDGRTRAVRRIDTTPPHDDEYALGRTKLANGLTLLAQGMPAILQGTEWAEDEGWEVNKIDWSHKEAYRGIFDFYRRVIGLRTTRRALFANSPANVFHVNDGANVLAFERFGSDGRSFVVVANFSNADFGDYILGVPRPGPWGVVINSEEDQYRGTGRGFSPGPIAVENIPRDGFGQRVRLQLPPHSLLLLQHEPEYVVDAGELDRTLDGVVDAADIEVLAFGIETRLPGTDVNGDLERNVFDLLEYLARYDAR